MGSCKDCVHVEVCKMHYRQKCELTYESKREVEIAMRKAQKAVDIECDYYKDRSLFVELPIKPGEKVFYFDTGGRIYETTVTQLVYGASGFLIDSDVMFNSNLIGKRFFLTREAAEQALKERESNAN